MMALVLATAELTEHLELGNLLRRVLEHEHHRYHPANPGHVLAELVAQVVAVFLLREFTQPLNQELLDFVLVLLEPANRLADLLQVVCHSLNQSSDFRVRLEALQFC